jgi:hypothetical protein
MNNETIILMNEEELKEKYFSFGTSLKRHFKKLCNRVGRENLIEVRESRSGEGKVNWWQCKVPLKYLSRAHFGIRKYAAERSFEREVAKSDVEARPGNFNPEKAPKG